MTDNIHSRRRFIKLAVLGAASVPLVGKMMGQTVQAADLPALTEADATASALGYKEDSSKVDAAKYASHKAEQVCANCSLAQAAQADGRHPCSIFPGKSVSAKGWCSAWAKKA
jgi:hypothetical protein